MTHRPGFMARRRTRAGVMAAATVWAISIFSACATAQNYPDVTGPRYHGEYAGQALVPAVKVVTLNLKYAREVATAIQLLREVPALRDADVVALQEMDDAGTSAIARALALNYVYYPGAIHPNTKRDFGNALLARWPIEADAKLLLPHPGRFRHMQRIAVGATIRVRDVPLRCYSVHLETPGAVSGQQRREQAAAILEDAAGFDRVVVAGDFNNQNIVATAFQEGGYQWITRGEPHTISHFRWDHVFARGLRLRDVASAGVVRESRGVSDHKPVWAELVLE
jgi:endonuclease/exonuclease/phosphatase family metal-dependent hydrolase